MYSSSDLHSLGGGSSLLRRGLDRSRGIGGRSSHLLGELGGRKHLLGGVLDNTARDGQVGALLEVKIDLARALATLVDTPVEKIVLAYLSKNDVQKSM